MKRRMSILILALLLFSLLIFLNNNFPPVKFFSSVVQNIFATPKAFIYGLRTNKDSLSDSEIKKLRGENEKLRKKLVDFERMKRDNEALRSQFETQDTKQYRLLPSRVIGFLGRVTSPTTLVIDRGEGDGVKSGMAAVYENNLVGKVNKVSPSYSQVALANNSISSLVGVTSEGNVPGLVIGQEDFILFDRVAVSEKVLGGETILTKGEINDEGFGIPPNLIIGRVSSVNKNESLPYQSAKVENALQFLRLDTVFIVLGL